ncbi:MAG: ribonuclease HI family protein [Candidatus Jacksonbacteria bacterium]|jgi:ribonuclease HI|nr:ribonuclease HI family protein [Candidatus Jacksonbacteria bacterium]MBT6033994.1 ribonuclease HI family protein [Candidatus Jacksonbacteria bacterium]MBT6301555.1 ribonuclease HI family protein [Candidatus Jacksonbacteria bacterium]MBT6757486.1 ribonuclease HI family protein [Candidatus Jacksonbacteria bacterium]MBT6955401.1 ribonuclease HI family protein [Candidatus Jacksonbacteria bacterium]
MKYTLFTDGGARGNPGPSAIGIVLKDVDGKIIEELGETIGNATNNQAEYSALLKGLEVALENKVQVIDCYLDSELVVKQLKQEYKVKDKKLAVLFVKAWNISKSFKGITFSHVPRSQNKRADKLVNDALDKEVGKK